VITTSILLLVPTILFVQLKFMHIRLIDVLWACIVVTLCVSAGTILGLTTLICDCLDKSCGPTPWP